MTIKTPRNTENAGGAEVCISRQAGKPLMLLVRMASREMGVWDSAWDSLCEYFTVAQFDLQLPSAAALEDPRSVFSKLAGDCVCVAKELGFKDFHLLGWTGGAHIALRCAADHPEMVRSCTLLSPFYPLPDMRPIEKGIEFMETMMEHGGRELYSYYWFMSGFSPAFLLSDFDNIARMVSARMAGDRFIKSDSKRAIKWIRALRGFWLDDSELASITTPVLIIGPGLDSGFVGPNSIMATRLHARIPGSSLEIAKNHGSLFLLEAPQLFPELSRKFFDRITR
jgi:pimeloyl-ACP methyl ester carboxylesterase